MSKVYGYCRVALKSEEEMAQQQKMVQDYCKDKGLKIDECFCDNGVSGLKFERSGLQKMFRTIKKDDIIVIKDIARLSRSMDQCMYFVKQIQEAGATLEIINI